MNIDDLKNSVTNLPMTYGYFSFNVGSQDSVTPQFPLPSIRSYNKTKGLPFYKHISRIIAPSILCQYLQSSPKTNNVDETFETL